MYWRCNCSSHAVALSICSLDATRGLFKQSSALRKWFCSRLIQIRFVGSPRKPFPQRLLGLARLGLENLLAQHSTFSATFMNVAWICLSHGSTSFAWTCLQEAWNFSTGLSCFKPIKALPSSGSLVFWSLLVEIKVCDCRAQNHFLPFASWLRLNPRSCKGSKQIGPGCASHG